MKNSYKTFLSFCCLFLIALACTKDVALITEVEFQLLEEHTADGFVNQGISTTVTIEPEEILENYEYNISYEILQGNGYFEDADGNRWETGTGKGLPIAFPLTTSLLYIGTEPGEHRLGVSGTDNFGFTKELEIAYNLKNVPARWEASSALTEIELGKGAELSLLFELVNTALDVSYEARFELASGSGALSPLEGDGYTLGGEYATIAPGTYPFVFAPSELGPQQLVFILRDSNGQEIKEELTFNVVENIRVISIFLGDDDTIEMQLGDEIAPDITFDPPNATDQGITLVSSDPDVVFIDENNVCIAVGLGTAVVTVTSTSNPEATDTVTVTVVEPDRIPVTSIIISQEDPTANGAVRQLTAAVLPENATDPSVTWASSDTAIATIGENGLLTGLTAGSVTITAASVSDPEVGDDIMVEITGGSLQNGSDITAFELPGQNGSDLDPATHTITVNVTDGTELNVAPSALSISGGATIAPGIADIQDFNTPVTYTVTAGDGTPQVWTVNVTVSPTTGSGENDITAFALPVQNNVSIDDVGHIITVNVPDGTVLSAIAPSVLTVSPGAEVAPIISATQDFNGAVVYTVTAGNGTPQLWTVNTTVAQNQSPVAVDDAIGLEVGQTITIDVLGNDTDLDTPNSQLVITNIGSVSPTGFGTASILNGRQIEFLSNGPATEPEIVTFVYTINDGNPGNDATATVTVNIVLNEILVTGITLAPTTLSLNIGQTGQLDATVTPANATNRALDWSSSDETVATVSASGEVTAISPGPAVITASSNDASNVVQTINVTVAPITNTSPVAVDDDFTVVENVTLSTSVISNDYDDDDDSLTVERVNNSQVNVGSAVNGGSGGQFTITAGGSIDFDPNGAFNDLSEGQSRETTVTYRITDGNDVSATATVTVTVTGADDLDTTAPEIVLTGGTVTFTVGDTFIEPGYSANDNEDGDITGNVVVGGGLDMNVAATYTVTYNVQDAAGNDAIGRTRTVIVESAPDTTPPVILLTGGTVTFTVGDTFIEPGYSANDNEDGNITGNVVVGGGLDMNVAATYTVTYNVQDVAGNDAVERTRTVVVEPGPNFTFNAFPEGGGPFASGDAIPITLMITPNAAAVAQEITFQISYTDDTGSLTEFDYEGSNFLTTEVFDVLSGQSLGNWEGPINGCYIGITFTVTNSIGLPSNEFTVHLSPAFFSELCN